MDKDRGTGLRLTSAIPGALWPAVLRGPAATLLSLEFQLEQTQWWPADRIRAEQFRQLDCLLKHAYNTVPYYRQKFGEAGISVLDSTAEEYWPRIPLLRRRDLQLHELELHSSTVPPAHGRISRTFTSGSTGQPVRVLKTDLTQLFWRAVTLRENFWHRRDFRGTMAAIRHTTDPTAQPPDGKKLDSWTDGLLSLETGPAYLMGAQFDVAQIAAWLERVNPDYLLAYPTMVVALAAHFRGRTGILTRLREVRTFGEILEPECRTAVRETWGVKVVDMYSSHEVGYLALQCPELEHYHVQSENALVEILTDDDRACEVGEIGRVVVTPLHNFAMPLLRYDIGDYAEVGESCSCGRGLPVLKRILGRQRNMVVLPNGARRWPDFAAGGRPEELPAVYQFQAIQRSATDIEIRLVRPEPLNSQEMARAVEHFRDVLGYPFNIEFVYVDAIPRNPTGKFEEFRLEWTPPER